MNIYNLDGSSINEAILYYLVFWYGKHFPNISADVIEYNTPSPPDECKT